MCNHPDLFEARPIISPFTPDNIVYRTSSLVVNALSSHLLERKFHYLFHLWRYDEDELHESALHQLAKKNIPLFIDDMSADVIPKSIDHKKYHNIISSYLNKTNTHRAEQWNMNNKLSEMRCDQPNINFSWRTVRACSIEPSFVSKVVLSRNHWKYRAEVTQAWYGLISSVDDRAASMNDIIVRYVVVLPKSMTCGPQLVCSTFSSGLSMSEKQLSQVKGVIEEFRKPFYASYIRQKIFFPDRKLVQFDSGKLQTLAVLLLKLKKEGHKCLIFTQMSKMLDIFEIFLNLHDFTYLRLDGSTSVERRQRLMDRFNTDPKIFCFILSTRSGGLGINLTGADTVIFYDSDWNPAMDAQAQDRAHRIGQTKEVHIYRLVCKSTVEENILMKAQQKRHLDFLVIAEGNFSEGSIFTSQNLQDMLSTNAISESKNNNKAGTSTNSSAVPVNAADMEAAMAAAEDADDVSALKTAIKEADAEQDEFNDNAPLKDINDPDDPADNETSGEIVKNSEDQKTNEDKEVDKEFDTWQASVGCDFKTIEAALKPVERYALRLHTDIEPFYSIHFLTEQQKLAEILAEEAGNLDIEQVEKEKELEEYRALSEGELLAANLTQKEVSRLKRWFINARAERYKQKLYRKLTGDCWSQVFDQVTGFPFWYNEDTGEASYAQPKVITERDMYIAARERKFNAIPEVILIHVLQFLDPFPDRIACSTVCAVWYSASIDSSFHKRVLSIETGAKEANNESLPGLGKSIFVSLTDAIASSRPGDTISLGAGHFWENQLIIRHPLKILGVDTESFKCVIEVSNGIVVESHVKSVVFLGVSIRRTRRGATDVPLVKSYGGHISVSYILFIYIE